MKKDDILNITSEDCRYKPRRINRRDFIRASAAPEYKTNIDEVKDIL